MPPVSRVLAYFATWHASLPHILVPHLDHPPPPQFCEMNGSVCQKLSGGVMHCGILLLESLLTLKSSFPPKSTKIGEPKCKLVWVEISHVFFGSKKLKFQSALFCG